MHGRPRRVPEREARHDRRPAERRERGLDTGGERPLVAVHDAHDLLHIPMIGRSGWDLYRPFVEDPVDRASLALARRRGVAGPRHALPEHSSQARRRALREAMPRPVSHTIGLSGRTLCGWCLEGGIASACLTTGYRERRESEYRARISARCRPPAWSFRALIQQFAATPAGLLFDPYEVMDATPDCCLHAAARVGEEDSSCAAAVLHGSCGDQSTARRAAMPPEAAPGLGVECALR